MSGVEPEVRIRAIAAGGDGVATLGDGRTVFVPRSAPGDRLRLRDIRRHARFARGEIAEVLEAGPDRVGPPCPHYTDDRCGGCQLMHLAPAAQRAAQGRIVGDALRRIARIDTIDPDVVAPPTEFGYRTKVTFTMQHGCMGYHPLDEPARVFEVRECLTAAAEVRELHAALRAARIDLPQHDARVVLRIDRSRRRHVVVRTGSGGVWTGGRALHASLRAAGIAAVIWWHPEGGDAEIVAGADTSWPATAFEQIHPEMGALVRHAALAALGTIKAMLVWDLYAGIGESTVALSAGGAVVESVESDPGAVQVAERLGPAGPRRHIGLVEAVAAALPKPDLVITNPPRIGMAERATDTLLRCGARRIVYVSCDPATLARDLARLSTKYRLASVQAFDQFPQTAHVESVAVLELQ